MKEKEKFGEWQVCPKCNGDGIVTECSFDEGVKVITVSCPVCNGAKVLARPILPPL